MSVYVSNIVIEQGYDFITYFQLEDPRTNTALPLSSATPEAQIRKHYGSNTSVSFASSIYDADAGVVSIALTSGQSVDLKPGRYVYDVKLTYSDGGEYKAVEGAALVRAGVTR